MHLQGSGCSAVLAIVFGVYRWNVSGSYSISVSNQVYAYLQEMSNEVAGRLRDESLAFVLLLFVQCDDSNDNRGLGLVYRA